MNTMTGDCLTPREPYDDEVLNANWLPQMLLSVLGLQPARVQHKTTVPIGSDNEADDFMQRLYRAQE